MKKLFNSWQIFILLFVLIFSFFAVACSAQEQQITGTLIGGYRVIPLELTKENVTLKVYRGDYIKFKIDNSFANPVLLIPSLSINQTIPIDHEAAPYFKMKKAGSFDFSLGQVKGSITVIEYVEPHYKKLTAKESFTLIKNIQPLILDVRTSMEYKQGHIKGSVLIPVQKLQARIKELEEYKNQDILIYCASGNRSTVASKILIDKGFKRIYNMQRGIRGWRKDKLPVVK